MNESVIRAKVAAAFRTLRKDGYFARMNFWCCQSCALAAMPDEVTKYAYYHHQDAEALPSLGYLHIRHGGTPEERLSIMRALMDAGLVVDWDRNPDKTMRVALDATSFK